MTRRTTIEVDEALLAEAQSILGTSGLKDTVDSALTRVIRTERRRRLAARLRTGAGLDFGERTAAQARTWRES
ncbi:MAG: type II toxin-antitoxin system VapB family antitoxin [Egibacteraceae bacterium]